MAEQNQQKKQVPEQDIHQLLKVRREKLAELQAAGKDPFQITKYDVTVHSTDVKDGYSEWEGKEVSIAGRMMSKRVMGKASFCNVQDLKGNIQCYVARDDLGEEDYKEFKRLDIGDIIGVKGVVFTTKMGEISIHAKSVTLLSKSLQVLPEKYHGLTNTDMRYRQRYTDLIMNEDVKKTFVMRSKIISCIRRYLDGQGFLEVETPMLVANAGGAAARPFETHYNALDEDVKLRISLELYLKRLIVGGMERVYEIGRVFRNEGLDTRHNPEFTLMELYQAYTDYNGMMDLTENMFRHVAQEVCGTTLIPYADVEIDLGKPFERLTMIDAIKKYTGIDFEEIKTTEEAKKLADEKDVHYEARHVRGDIINLFFEEFVEEHLIQPTFIMDHPVEVSPLTKRKPDKPELVERFELFIYGREMCNAYSELNDPIDQRERFKAQEAALAAGDEEANTTDEDFMNALEIGMPPTGGIGYGIDRLVMLLTNSPAIRDVLLFPTMKSLGGSDAKKGDGKAEKAASLESALGQASQALAQQLEAMPAAVSAPQLDLSKVKIEPLFEDAVDFDTFSKSDFRVVKVEACEAVPKSKKLLKFTLNDGTDRKRTILSGIHEYYEPEQLVGRTCVAITNLPPRKMMGIDSEGMLISAVYEYDGREGLNLLMLDDGVPAGAKLY
ncbi:MAG TPA: lysine--tRNA ligase [Candidatus Ventrimonas merdavium]|nr:lysine--tRNA ligase [Candidatus Ventrimonas merdavium]